MKKASACPAFQNAKILSNRLKHAIMGACVREKCPLALAPVYRGEKTPGYKTLEKGKDRL